MALLDFFDHLNEDKVRNNDLRVNKMMRFDAEIVR